MIGIVNYGAGNIFSITAALNRLGISYGMINTASDFDLYDKVIIPGVGHAGAAMEKLVESGLSETIKTLKKPVLGICVGMQLMTDFSEEGNADLLGIIPLKTLHFEGKVHEKVPHMGWNSIKFENNCPLFMDIPNNSYFYFVHSYYIEHELTYSVATCDYGLPFSAAIARENFWAVQFHPEKSGQVGEQLLRNFNNF
ncbi:MULTISPECIES: imidazole glycerol phosphate synthase subunit HisH [Sphingobacterium]|uniref:Imidazole glycerol phosphate synthase subunit HisH n=1 Tax=Sphingobacterium cellulitidis TaxID=1768011 RepID=A0A8H9KU72_9SPHI|nr:MULTISPECIES: imidazole glycerol phosphate synthase subunit HisH [Sphingobacterium]MBA8985512.1 glutamine amidotransferase [Sphingobacterium soli]OYD43992.1 imidazole glycerol phosphate synthase subunit HisH [Sphingobacterium cellulitidis]OYD47248.1 imidazole glycerol phosphate synthase subunit HisH [Sphingobacterium cellulitidis]WFB63933.1 imidazole glycerol phosphate synthase subunit HisH [Sphingobacterium sp. WM]GGE09116.1 imidazole glycerol phosphate synthase subunit HisH [Sphingobacter